MLINIIPQGLRTLVYAEKPLSADECEAFLDKYNEAATLMDGREEAVSSAGL